jgi:hypothetical protein
LTAEKVHSKTISCAQGAKYFSIIADCTPDIIYSCEQLSVTIWHVDVTNENNNNEMCEWFLGFTSTDDSSGKGLTDILNFLEKNKLELEHCRGQGYHNAANMKGKNSDV